MYELEKGIPITEKSIGRHLKKYPFTEMEVGDSFFVSVDGDALALRRKQLSLCGAALRNKPMKFTTRVVDGGVRIWRIA